jgi:superoxide reductase
MVEKNGIYKCEHCGNVVSIIEAKNPPIVCCGEEMKLLEEKTGEQEGKEKHVPVIEQTEKGIKIKVGSIPHPMEEEHSIQLIQLLINDTLIAEVHLNPGETPEAEFNPVIPEGAKIKARALCNVHGLWSS